MKKSQISGSGPVLGLVFMALILGSLVVGLIAFRKGVVFKSKATGQTGVPADVPAKGLIYKGLEKPSDGSCPGGFAIYASTNANGKARCTHGPDPAPPGYDVSKSVEPIIEPQTYKISPTNVLGVACDGDGTSGKRVQVLYVRASDVADRYDAFASSFQNYLSTDWLPGSGDNGVDYTFVKSAEETGGVRHVRFVHDSSCNPIVERIVLSSAGDDTFGNTISELGALGYNRQDRKYIIFMDAHVYCGLSTIEYDDRSGTENMNNFAPGYSRIDNGCWSGLVAAHELGHSLGAVQLSAPHSSLEWHCYDQADLMCRPTNGTPTQSICAWPGFQRLDCNHDDYYSTNPPAGNYLATHWNVANSAFLIGAVSPPATQLSIESTSLGTYKKSGKSTVAINVFKSRDTVLVKVKATDSSAKIVSGATVQLSVVKPDSSKQCSFSVTTDSTGYGSGSCKLPQNAVKGSWNAHVENIAVTGYVFDAAGSVVDSPFTVE